MRLGRPRLDLLADVVASMHAGLYATDADGVLVLVNPAALRMLGRSEEELLGQPMHERSHYQTPDGQPLPRDRCALLGVLQTGRPARCADDTFWRGDGRPVRVSWISAPIVKDDTLVGAVVVFDDATRQHVQTERLLEQYRAAVDAQEHLAETNDRLALLGRLSRALATLDTDETLERLARFTVGTVADACVVDELQGDVVRRVAVADTDALGPSENVKDLALPAIDDAEMVALARALAARTQHTVALDANGGARRDPEGDPLSSELSRLLAASGCRQALVTPLRARREVLGAMTWLRRDRAFTDADRFLAAEIAGQAGAALGNARVYTQQRKAAETLQRSLLSVLPEPDHLELTARYLPASEGVEVGGDWYDAFVLGDGATNVVIGDILGHDLAAAALMGQVRNLLRAIAADRLEPPSEVLGRLDATIETLRVDALATCLLARISQSPEQRAAGVRELRWASAGHVPPVLVDAQGSVRQLEEANDVMLGVAPGLARRTAARELRPGDTLWLYTDGLVERADQPLDVGLTRLRRTLAGLAALPLEEACEELLVRMLPAGHPDDVAVLAVRVHPEHGPSPHAAPRNTPPPA